MSRLLSYLFFFFNVAYCLLFIGLVNDSYVNGYMSKFVLSLHYLRVGLGGLSYITIRQMCYHKCIEAEA